MKCITKMANEYLKNKRTQPMTAEQLEELLGKVTPDWCVDSEPEVGLEPSLFEGRVGHEGFGPIEPLQGYDIRLAALAPSLARRVIAAGKMVEALEVIAEIDDDGYTSDGHERCTGVADEALTAYREAIK